jgi:hypothetical protein
MKSRFENRLLEKIQRMKNREVERFLEQFPLWMTAEAFCRVLLQLNRQSAPISMEMLRDYRAFGEFYDQLYLWVHGTLSGSYISCVDEPEQEPFPLAAAKERFEALPISIKPLACILIAKYIAATESGPLQVSRRRHQIIEELTKVFIPN